MQCPYCNEELNYQSFYYKGNYEAYEKGYAGIEKLGDIYQCNNENCRAYEQHFYTDMQGNLHEGYPC